MSIQLFNIVNLTLFRFSPPQQVTPQLQIYNDWRMIEWLLTCTYSTQINREEKRREEKRREEKRREEKRREEKRREEKRREEKRREENIFKVLNDISVSKW